MTSIIDAQFVALPAARAPGRLSQALIRLLMKPAAVIASEDLGGGFRLVTIEGPALADIAWVPGQKIQIAMGSAFVARTYTPIEWNSSAGRTCILGYAHGEGPGSLWLRGAAPGDACDLFGPRGSLDLREAAGPLALFGDETSVGLGYALARRDGKARVACHFEANDKASAGRVIAELGIGDAALFERRADGAHLDAMEAALPALIEAGASFVLTGKAGTIQRLRQSLKILGVPGRRVFAKAYWAPGKTGLD